MIRRSSADLLTSSLSPPQNAFAAQHVTAVHVLSAALMLRYVYRVPRRLRMMGVGSLVLMTLEPWQLGLGSGTVLAEYAAAERWSQGEGQVEIAAGGGGNTTGSMPILATKLYPPGLPTD